MNSPAKLQSSSLYVRFLSCDKIYHKKDNIYLFKRLLYLLGQIVT